MLLSSIRHLVRIRITQRASHRVIKRVPFLVVIFSINSKKILRILLYTRRNLYTMKVINGRYQRRNLNRLTTVTNRTRILLLVCNLRLNIRAASSIILRTINLGLYPIFRLVKKSVLSMTNSVRTNMNINTINASNNRRLIVLIKSKRLKYLMKRTISLTMSNNTLNLINLNTMRLRRYLGLIRRKLLLNMILYTRILNTLRRRILRMINGTNDLNKIILTARARKSMNLCTQDLLVSNRMRLPSVIRYMSATLRKITISDLMTTLTNA